MLHERDGVSAQPLGVAIPATAGLDSQTIHLPGSVVVSDAPDLIAQMGQQLRQIGVIGGVYLSIGVVPVRGHALCASSVVIFFGGAILMTVSCHAEPHMP